MAPGAGGACNDVVEVSSDEDEIQSLPKHVFKGAAGTKPRNSIVASSREKVIDLTCDSRSPSPDPLDTIGSPPRPSARRKSKIGKPKRRNSWEESDESAAPDHDYNELKGDDLDPLEPSPVNSLSRATGYKGKGKAKEALDLPPEDDESEYFPSQKEIKKSPKKGSKQAAADDPAQTRLMRTEPSSSTAGTSGKLGILVSPKKKPSLPTKKSSETSNSHDPKSPTKAGSGHGVGNNASPAKKTSLDKGKGKEKVSENKKEEEVLADWTRRSPVLHPPRKDAAGTSTAGASTNSEPSSKDAILVSSRHKPKTPPRSPASTVHRATLTSLSRAVVSAAKPSTPNPVRSAPVVSAAAPPTKLPLPSPKPLIQPPSARYTSPVWATHNALQATPTGAKTSTSQHIPSGSNVRSTPVTASTVKVANSVKPMGVSPGWATEAKPSPRTQNAVPPTPPLTGTPNRDVVSDVKGKPSSLTSAQPQIYLIPACDPTAPQATSYFPTVSTITPAYPCSRPQATPNPIQSPSQAEPPSLGRPRWAVTPSNDPSIALKLTPITSPGKSDVISASTVETSTSSSGVSEGSGELAKPIKARPLPKVLKDLLKQTGKVAQADEDVEMNDVGGMERALPPGTSIKLSLSGSKRSSPDTPALAAPAPILPASVGTPPTEGSTAPQPSDNSSKSNSPSVQSTSTPKDQTPGGAPHKSELLAKKKKKRPSVAGSWTNPSEFGSHLKNGKESGHGSLKVSKSAFNGKREESRISGSASGSDSQSRASTPHIPKNPRPQLAPHGQHPAGSWLNPRPFGSGFSSAAAGPSTSASPMQAPLTAEQKERKRLARAAKARKMETKAQEMAAVQRKDKKEDAKWPAAERGKDKQERTDARRMSMPVIGATGRATIASNKTSSPSNPPSHGLPQFTSYTSAPSVPTRSVGPREKHKRAPSPDPLNEPEDRQRKKSRPAMDTDEVREIAELPKAPASAPPSVPAALDTSMLAKEGPEMFGASLSGVVDLVKLRKRQSAIKGSSRTNSMSNLSGTPGPSRRGNGALSKTFTQERAGESVLDLLSDDSDDGLDSDNLPLSVGTGAGSKRKRKPTLIAGLGGSQRLEDNMEETRMLLDDVNLLNTQGPASQPAKPEATLKHTSGRLTDLTAVLSDVAISSRVRGGAQSSPAGSDTEVEGDREGLEKKNKGKASLFGVAIEGKKRVVDSGGSDSDFAILSDGAATLAKQQDRESRDKPNQIGGRAKKQSIAPSWLFKLSKTDQEGSKLAKPDIGKKEASPEPMITAPTYSYSNLPRRPRLTADQWTQAVAEELQARDAQIAGTNKKFGAQRRMKEKDYSGLNLYLDLSGITAPRLYSIPTPQQTQYSRRLEEDSTYNGSDEDSDTNTRSRSKAKGRKDFYRAPDASASPPPEPDVDLQAKYPDPPVPRDRIGTAKRTYDETTMHGWAALSSRSQSQLACFIFKSYIQQSTAGDPGGSDNIPVHNTVDDDQRPPDLDFVYSNEMYYPEPMPAPEKGLGCGCDGPCDPKSTTCTCLQRQQLYFFGIEIEGFAYDENGHIIESSAPVWECSDTCGCPPECMNRVVQKGRSPQTQVELFKTELKGWGVRAGCNIPRGTFIGTYAGELVTEAESEKRGVVYTAIGKTYVFDLDGYQIRRPPKGLEKIDPRLAILAEQARKRAESSNKDEKNEEEHSYNAYSVDAFHYGFTRFLNHSCDPNLAIAQAYVKDFHPERPILVIFTHKDVKKGEELCISYKGIPDEEEIKAAIRDNVSAKNKGGRTKKSDKAKAKAKAKADGNGLKRTVADDYYVCRCGAPNCDGIMFPGM
ncbi:hypothetical protein IAR50_007051 [Cryptococcus sp. DSM 104548]